MEKYIAEGSFVDVLEVNETQEATVLKLGYSFKTHSNALGFKLWDSSLKCNNPYRCIVDRRDVDLVPSTAYCESENVHLLLPRKPQTRMSCVRDREITDEDLRNFDEEL